MRALLRLVRKSLGKEVYRRENACYRDLGRRLSGARDACVRSTTLSRLLEKADALPANGAALASLAEALERRHREALKRLADERRLETTSTELETARCRIEGWPALDDGFATLRPNLGRVYRRGIRAFAAARSSGGADDLHEWRKRAKYLRYHLGLLESAWPEVLAAFESSMHELTDALGDDHDLAELASLAEAERGLVSDPARERLLVLIQRLRRDQQQRALELGRRLYGETDEQLLDRLEIYWDAWRAGPPKASPEAETSA
jgi:CHAD domain-containing protein